MTSRDRRPIPRATYRLQFSKDLGFAAAAKLAPYLAKLGVSHVYASPYLKAQPGSTHGYDVVSHSELNPELGSAEAFAQMVAAFKTHGLGQILDIVPNHMGIGGAENARWLDVLEWGRSSQYADWFDIDWNPIGPHLEAKILVPFLGDHYAAVLQSGELSLSFDPVAGSFSVWAHRAHKLPISPLHYDRILGTAHPDLERLGDAFAHLRLEPQMASRAVELKAALARGVKDDRAISNALGQEIESFIGRVGDVGSWAKLHALIADQHWRVAHFRSAADEINYRRFFSINELAGVRVELPEVFDHVHSLVFRLIEEGVLDGLRIDHLDGLFDPKQYCLELRKKSPRPIYLVAEKILAADETLRADWNLDGTTGYDFAALLTALLVDPGGEERLTRFYREFTGRSASFADIAHDSKSFIIDSELASEISRLAGEAADLARANPRTAGFTANALRRALQLVVASLPVYRTYVEWSGPTESDRHAIDKAVAEARRHAGIDPAILDFLQALLTTDIAAPGSSFSRSEVVRLAMRIQQYTGAVMAKGVEDTAFYRYNRMLALNEVGGDPERFGMSLAGFHAAMSWRAKTLPHAMLATSTHDTKRSEDARARLALISELADEWSAHVQAWSSCLREEPGKEAAPDRNDEYAFYQLLLGIWPAESVSRKLPDAAALDELTRRLEAAMLKTVREAKQQTSWVSPNLPYEEAVQTFVRRALYPTSSKPFLKSFGGFAERVAELGVHNSLAQTVLKLTLPGVPDIYQGAELWDLSLVDPDNRRRPNYDWRKRLLGEDDQENEGLGRLMRSWRDGRIKLRLVRRLLEVRKASPDLFESSCYMPIYAEGPAADRICAFARRHKSSLLFVAVTRFPSRSLARQSWSGTTLPAPAGESAWVSVLDQRAISPAGPTFTADELFADAPVSVLLG